MKKSESDKCETVIGKNTFYFFDTQFEEYYEGHITSLKDTLLNVKNRIETEGIRKHIFEDLIFEKDNGLRALLALSGFSNEYLKRLITIIRIVDLPELNNLVYKDKWHGKSEEKIIEEWSDRIILNLIKENKYFRKGLVNIFFEGASVKFLADTIPLFELKKLSISKLKFEMPEMIDSLVRYKEKGSYSGKKGNNPEIVINKILNDLDITYETGDLPQLEKNESGAKRTMDFIIPNKQCPKIIIECSFLSTTSSGQGDKAKTEIGIDKLIKQYYPNTIFIGFVDGIGWYVRKEDLKRMVSAYRDVFTFHNDELIRFREFVSGLMKNG